MTLLPHLSDEQRRDLERQRRLEESLRAAREAQEAARAEMERLALRLGFPLASSWRPEEKQSDDA